MLREYSHTKSESLAQIRTITAEIQHFFLGDCFYWRTLHISMDILRRVVCILTETVLYTFV